MHDSMKKERDRAFRDDRGRAPVETERDSTVDWLTLTA